MNRFKGVSLSCLFVMILFAQTLIILPACGTPGNGTSITVTNDVLYLAPSSVWTYTVTELNAPKNRKPFTASFALSAEGEDTCSFGGLRSGAYRVVETSPNVERPFGEVASMKIESNQNNDVQVVSGFEVVVNITSSEGKKVTFTTNAMPAFAYSGFSLPPPPQSYSIPPLQPIPVQAAWNVDINNDGRLDLVLDKSTAIVVNLTGPTFPPEKSVTVSVAFEGNVYYTIVQGSDLSDNPVVSYNPILPSSAGDKEITGIYQVDGDDQVALTTTNVAVKDTISLSLYYVPLSKSRSYDLPDNPSEMMDISSEFIDATYPVKSVTATLGQSIEGSRSGSRRDPYSGMLADIQAVAQQAQLNMGGSAIGVAIVPPEYFTYHGFEGAAGVSFGPSVKGVIAVDGYWTVPAHEIAHTFGLYYGTPEEYVRPGNPFFASGVNSEAGEWENGYSFMSIADYRSTSNTWVNSSSTYEFLFNKTRIIQDDPEILLVSGIVKNDTDPATVEFPYDWIHMHDGFADTITPGDYSLNFIGSGDIPAPISFGLSFNMQISIPGEPNEDWTPIEGFGDGVDSNETGFNFAIPYPPDNVEAIQVLDNEGTLLATYEMAKVQSFGCSASFDGEEGLNDWYISPVQVTITGFVDPTTTDPPISIDSINYILDKDGVIHSIPGASGQLDPPITTEGNHTLEYWCVDGMDASRKHTESIAIDETAPTITINSPSSTTYIIGESVVADWSATDYLSGIGSSSGTVESGLLIDTSSAGEKTFTVNAIDNAGNPATVTITYRVSAYNFDGFLSPVPGSVYNVGRTIPVKFKLSDYQGNSVTTAVAEISVTVITDDGYTLGPWPGSTKNGSEGNLFSLSGDQYIFNLDTSSLPAGTLWIRVDLDDGTYQAEPVTIT